MFINCDRDAFNGYCSAMCARSSWRVKVTCCDKIARRVAYDNVLPVQTFRSQRSCHGGVSVSPIVTDLGVTAAVFINLTSLTACDVAMMEDIVCVFSVNRLLLLLCCYPATARNATLHLCAFDSEVS